MAKGHSGRGFRLLLEREDCLSNCGLMGGLRILIFVWGVSFGGKLGCLVIFLINWYSCDQVNALW